MAKVEKEVIILNESAVASVIKDLVTFIMFAGVMWFNHAYLGGNWLVDVVFIIFIFMWLSSLKLSQVFKGNRAEAITWLKENHDN